MEKQLVSATTMNFLMIFDAFLLPVKFVASVRNSMSSQNEDCIDELSNQSRKRIVQTVDPRSLLTEHNHNLLTLEQS